MDSNKSFVPYMILCTYVCVLLIDWLYVFIIQAQPDIIVNAWFYFFPLMTFFYCAFGFIALLGLIVRSRQGFSLALAVILFGVLSTAISYLLAHQTNPGIDQMFIGIAVINAGQLLFMARNARFYTKP